MARHLVASLPATAGGWPALVSALGTAVVALLGVLGLVIANKRLRRATAAVDADAFPRPGGVGIRVRFAVRSAGLARLTLEQGEANAPSITVTEVRLPDRGDGRDAPAASWRKSVLIGEVVDPGETASGTQVLLVGAPVERTLGWSVSFDFAIGRRWPRSGLLWWWTDTTFVPVPVPVPVPAPGRRPDGGDPSGAETAGAPLGTIEGGRSTRWR